MSGYGLTAFPSRWLNRYNLGRALVAVVVALVWEVLSRVIGATFLPGPGRTYEVLVRGFATQGFLSDTLVTLQGALYAYILAIALGLPFGVFIGLNRLGYDVFEPPVVSLYAVPKLTFYPIFLFVLGVGFNTKWIYAGISGFFPMALLTMRAIQSIDETYLSVGRSLALSRYQQFRHIIFPTTLVQIVVALRITFSSMFVSLIVAELFASRDGLGLILQKAIGVFDAEKIMAVTVIIFVIAFIINILLYGAQRGLERRWNMTAEDMNI